MRIRGKTQAKSLALVWPNGRQPTAVETHCSPVPQPEEVGRRRAHAQHSRRCPRALGHANHRGRHALISIFSDKNPKRPASAWMKTEMSFATPWPEGSREPKLPSDSGVVTPMVWA